MKGNEIYTQQELTDYIFKDGKNKNTFVFWLKAKPEWEKWKFRF